LRFCPKKLFKWLLWILVAHLLYLSVVVVWAANSYQVLRADYVLAPLMLSPEYEQILLKVEDPRFYEHLGVDISMGQGLTTITSSLARDFYLYGKKLGGVAGLLQSFYRSIFNCCKAIDIGRDFMALTLNYKMSKADQLNAYLTRIYMGQSNGKAVIGLAAASQEYFQRPLVQLGRADFIHLVAMIKAPSRYHPRNNSLALDERALRITRLIDGECQPHSWLDTDYDRCVPFSH
jgi:membrane carboxypeptidase/penicillin-binding protein PbpC